MKNILYIIIILVLSGCGNEKEPPPEKTMTLKEQFEKAVSEGVVEDTVFPYWLFTMTSRYEFLEKYFFPKWKIFVFKGEWNNQTVYFIYHNMSSRYSCRTYYENREIISWPDSDSTRDFQDTSKNWQLIYDLGTGEYEFATIIFEEKPPPEETMPLKEQLENAVSEGVVENVAFPDWLIPMTSQYEIWEENSFPKLKIFIFKGEWNNRTVYFIYDNMSSCYLCWTYYEDGVRIDWLWVETGMVMDFQNTSKNWQLIYDLGEGNYFFHDT